jgi:hypothetical protein
MPPIISRSQPAMSVGHSQRQPSMKEAAEKWEAHSQHLRLPHGGAFPEEVIVASSDETPSEKGDVADQTLDVADQTLDVADEKGDDVDEKGDAVDKPPDDSSEDLADVFPNRRRRRERKAAMPKSKFVMPKAKAVKPKSKFVKPKAKAVKPKAVKPKAKAVKPRASQRPSASSTQEFDPEKPLVGRCSRKSLFSDSD